jgi:SAM-dependent methyltransferase
MTRPAHAALDKPSPWVARWAALVTHGPVLDVACGGGRHARWFAARGFDVVAIDREPQAIPGVRFVQADLEGGRPWPLAGERFGAVIVVNYLHRPLFGAFAEALGAGGILIYETFMTGNERFGRPSNPDYLLRPGELLEAFGALQVVAFEQGLVRAPRPARLQRICAVQRQRD